MSLQESDKNWLGFGVAVPQAPKPCNLKESLVEHGLAREIPLPVFGSVNPRFISGGESWVSATTFWKSNKAVCLGDFVIKEIYPI